MKRSILIALLFPFWILAQTKTTQGTQIVTAVHIQKNEIAALYLLADIKKDKKALQNCKDCTYFLGELVGAYEQQGAHIKAKSGATVKVFTEQEVFVEKAKFPSSRFKIKNDVSLGKAKATVIKNKKGELILKTKTQ